MTAPVPGQDGERLDWTFAGMAHSETLAQWLDRVHPTRYDTEDGSFARCPTCEEWSPCSVRAAVAPGIAADAAREARQQCADELRALMLSPDSWLTVDGCDSLSTVALDGLADRWSAPADDEETP